MRHRVFLAILLPCVVWVMSAGLLRNDSARFFDSRYFVVAGKCWVNGESPYNFERYKEVWAATCWGQPDAPFLYPPTAAVACAPLGFLDWPLAAYLWQSMSVAAYLAMLVGLWLIAKPIRTNSVVWFLLASTLGSIPAVLLTGQSSILVACGLSWLVVSIQRKSLGLAVFAILLASLKPHLSGPVFLATVIMDRWVWKPMAIAGLIAIALTCGTMLAQPTLLTDLISIPASYARHPANAPRNRIGLGSLLSSLGMPSAPALYCSLILLGCSMVAIYMRSRRSPSRTAPMTQSRALTAVLALPGIGMSMQGYDLVVLAPLFVFLAQLPSKSWWAMLPASLCLWRPTVLSRVIAALGAPPSSMSVLMSSAWLAITLLALAQCLCASAHASEAKR